MTYEEALQVLMTIPDTFRRVGPNYDSWHASKMTAIARFVSGDDSIIAQLSSVSSANLRWLDTFGLLFGVKRRSGERDSTYASRVQKTCVANHCSPLNIVAFLSLTLAIDSGVEENLPEVGWSLNLANAGDLTDESSISDTLIRVRPAGVPFSYAYPTGGLYMTSNVFRDKPFGYGSFLSSGTKTREPTTGGSTNAATSPLPTVFLTDTTINPSLG